MSDPITDLKAIAQGPAKRPVRCTTRRVVKPRAGEEQERPREAPSPGWNRPSRTRD